MENKNRTISWLSINTQLINCLKTKTNNKFSRYDAFIWLLERILFKGDYADGYSSCSYSASYIKLADKWKWTRQTVQNFIEELMALSFISAKRQVNAYTFTLSDKLRSQIILE